MIVSEDKLWDTNAVAHYLDVDRKTVISLVERGELRGYRVGRNWRFRKNDVEEFLERQQAKPEQGERD
jgi:excisionase family DNA binding protein